MGKIISFRHIYYESSQQPLLEDIAKTICLDAGTKKISVESLLSIFTNTVTRSHLGNDEPIRIKIVRLNEKNKSEFPSIIVGLARDHYFERENSTITEVLQGFLLEKGHLKPNSDKKYAIRPTALALLLINQSKRAVLMSQEVQDYIDKNLNKKSEIISAHKTSDEFIAAKLALAGLRFSACWTIFGVQHRAKQTDEPISLRVFNPNFDDLKDCFGWYPKSTLEINDYLYQ